MDKRQRKRLVIAIAMTTASVITAAAYLTWRIWDYWSADHIYSELCGDAVRHVSINDSNPDDETEPAGQSDGRNIEKAGNSNNDSDLYRAGLNSNMNIDAENHHGASSNDNSGESDMPVIDWQQLDASGDDIVAWLEIPGLGIGYPVVQGEDNEYYLHHLPNGDYKNAGSIFMEKDNNPDFTDANTILYGHNMENGSMFGKFRNMTQEDYEKNHDIWICTKNITYLYSIFSVHISEVGDESYMLFSGKTNDSQIYSWIRSENSRSYLNTRISHVLKYRVITLSTCASTRNERRIIQGVLTGEFIDREDERPP